MTFNWLNKQGVESSSGYMVQRMHRFYYHYIEGDHTMVVNVEPGLEYEEVIWDRNGRWQPPHQSEEIPQERLTEIQKNISTALSFMKTPHVFKIQ
jgi:hypothetical protein